PGLRAGRLDGEPQVLGGQVRGRVDPLDVGGRDRLHPDGLPDARGGRVEDAVSGGALFAERLRPDVGRVVDSDQELLRSGAPYGVGDVRGEGVVSAGVGGDPHAVDVDGGVVADGLEA